MKTIAQHIKRVIDYALREVDLYSDDVAVLLLRTACVESRLECLFQLNDGPARSYFQLERDTINDIVINYLDLNRPKRLNAVERLIGFDVHDEMLMEVVTVNIAAAAVFARLKYRMCPGKIPPADDLDGQWDYYKEFYNTHLGSAEKPHWDAVCEEMGV